MDNRECPGCRAEWLRTLPYGEQFGCLSVLVNGGKLNESVHCVQDQLADANKVNEGLSARVLELEGQLKTWQEETGKELAVIAVEMATVQVERDELKKELARKDLALSRALC